MSQNMPAEFGQEVGPYETGNEFENESFGENEAYESSEQEYGESEQESLGEMEQMEMASAFMEINSEQELDHFLGDMISNATKSVGDFVSSPTGQAIGGVLKQVAGQALPAIGQMVGQRYGGAPGAMIGNQLGTGVAHALGLELEGLSNEDREFEVARHFVRFADAAARLAGEHARRSNDIRRITPSSASGIARTAVLDAAKQFAPGLVRVVTPIVGAGPARKPNQSPSSQGSQSRPAPSQPAPSGPAPDRPSPSRSVPGRRMSGQVAPPKPGSSGASNATGYVRGSFPSFDQLSASASQPPARSPGGSQQSSYSFTAPSAPAFGGADFAPDSISASGGPIRRCVQTGRWFRRGRRVFVYGL